MATLRTIDSPLGMIGDEWGRSMRLGRATTVIMIEVTQVTNLLAQARDLQSIVEVGRTCAAFGGGLLVFATFWLARSQR
jgi:hypothetical protein